MTTILFFDDWQLHRRENLTRHIGKPTLVPEGTLEDPYANPGWGYPSVTVDPETGRWRCHYQAQIEGGRFVALMAESDDGIQWELPDLTDRVAIPDRLLPHQVFDMAESHEWCTMYRDPNAAGTDAAYKGLVADKTDTTGIHANLVASPDGLNWNYVDGVKYHPFGMDPAAHAFWNSHRQSYVITMRPRYGDRRIAVSETKDWRAFSAPELALWPDALDAPCAQIYGMPVFPYENIYVGLPWIYHTDPSVAEGEKSLMGKIDCQLSYSPNGWHFQRTLREPLIPNSEAGEHGAGCVYTSSMVIDGDTIRLYSSASKGEHRQFPPDPAMREGAILLHTMRRDGFVYLEPPGGTGELVTRILKWGSGEPELNVSTPFGEVRAQVFGERGEPLEGYGYEDSAPFQGDSISWSPQWREGRQAGALGGQRVRLGVKLVNGRLYAVRGDFEIVRG